MLVPGKGSALPFSQTPRPPIPDEAVLQFVEGELRLSGRLNGFSACAYLAALERRGVTPSVRAGLRLALAMYGERVDPAAHALFREAIAASGAWA
jgi:hypothetical protein